MNISIITPTTGKKSLFKLIDSLKSQELLRVSHYNIEYEHILLWDNFREDEFKDNKTPSSPHLHPYDLSDKNTYSIIIPGSMISNIAPGSALRSIGLMAARGDFVTFADDDVWFDPNHLNSLLQAVCDKSWAYSMRKIWHNDEYIGVDNFESVGDSPTRKVSYEMVDNNVMIFQRQFGTSGACLYRETKEYNDDRLMYAFLKEYAGVPGKTGIPTVNQECPSRLVEFFKANCAK